MGPLRKKSNRQYQKIPRFCFLHTRILSAVGLDSFGRLDGRWTFSFVHSHLTNVTAAAAEEGVGGDRFCLGYIIPPGPWRSCMPVKVYSRFVYVNFHLHTSDTLSTAYLLPLPLNASLLPGGCTPVVGLATLFQTPPRVFHPSSPSVESRTPTLPPTSPAAPRGVGWGGGAVSSCSDGCCHHRVENRSFKLIRLTNAVVKRGFEWTTGGELLVHVSPCCSATRGNVLATFRGDL